MITFAVHPLHPLDSVYTIICHIFHWMLTSTFSESHSVRTVEGNNVCVCMCVYVGVYFFVNLVIMCNCCKIPQSVMVICFLYFLITGILRKKKINSEAQMTVLQ